MCTVTSLTAMCFPERVIDHTRESDGVHLTSLYAASSIGTTGSIEQ